MIIACTGINSRDRELLVSYLASQEIPSEDVGSIADECIAKANESYPQPRGRRYSDFATVYFNPGGVYAGSKKWIIEIDRAYNPPHG